MSLSNVLSFRWRLNKNIQSTPTGAIIYAYLLDRCSCLSVGNLVCQVSGMRRNEKCPVKTDDDGGVCITQPRQSTPASGSVNLICSELPLLTDLLPGVYRLTCQMRLRRHVRLLVVHLCSPRSCLSVYWWSSQWWYFAGYASPRSLLIRRSSSSWWSRTFVPVSLVGKATSAIWRSSMVWCYSHRKCCSLWSVECLFWNAGSKSWSNPLRYLDSQHSIEFHRQQLNLRVFLNQWIWRKTLFPANQYSSFVKRTIE